MKLMKQEGHIGFRSSAMIRYKSMHLCFCFFNIFTFLRCLFGVFFQNSNSKAELNKRFISKGFLIFFMSYNACFQQGIFPFGLGDMRSFEGPGEQGQFAHLLGSASNLFIQLTPSSENRFHT